MTPLSSGLPRFAPRQPDGAIHLAHGAAPDAIPQLAPWPSMRAAIQRQCADVFEPWSAKRTALSVAGGLALGPCVGVPVGSFNGFVAAVYLHGQATFDASVGDPIRAFHELLQSTSDAFAMPTLILCMVSAPVLTTVYSSLTDPYRTKMSQGGSVAAGVYAGLIAGILMGAAVGMMMFSASQTVFDAESTTVRDTLRLTGGALGAVCGAAGVFWLFRRESGGASC